MAGRLSAIASIDPEIGGDDAITARDGSSTILGGAGSDAITLGSGTQVVLGDSGSATFESGQIATVTSIATDIGGADTIQADDGDVTILGGFGADAITVGTGNHVILGDNGQATFAAGRLSAIASIDPEIGGDDAITARDGRSTILGGAGSDAITLGSGTQVVLGDSGSATFENGQIATVTSIATDIGGADTIQADDGDATIIGGAGADRITVGTGNHVILGDNGQATFAAGRLTAIASIDPEIGGDDAITARDGSSTILGGAGSDAITLGSGTQVVLGDSGSATFENGQIATVTSIATDIGGADTIQADDGDATIIGGAGADRITVGMGNHVILGDNGQATFAAGRLSAIASIDPEIGG
ncbi:calcium-binding protein, partial [Methylobacterium aquaticum]|uniref:calcium-binding protein n=1 Tax=Methylobacterium aquaticum TaxID=270351 RepID=UPI003D17C7AA